jgi:hypothetical protein
MQFSWCGLLAIRSGSEKVKKIKDALKAEGEEVLRLLKDSAWNRILSIDPKRPGW